MQGRLKMNMRIANLLAACAAAAVPFPVLGCQL